MMMQRARNVAGGSVAKELVALESGSGGGCFKAHNFTHTAQPDAGMRG